MKPNVSFPLTPSYNPRGTIAYTNAAAGSDQRKLNGYYEIAQSIAGKNTVYLTKRPGVLVSAGSFGAGTQTPFLVVTAPGLFAVDNPWVIAKDGSAIKALSSAAATTILSSADHNPCYVDHANVNGTDTVVVQLRNNTTITAVQRAFYSSSIGTWTEITDSVFTGISHRGKMELMDGRAFILGANNRIYQSDFNTLATWSAGGYIPRSMSNDVPLGLARLRDQLLAFGEDCCEVMVNAGNPSGSVLLRQKSFHRNIGLGSVAVPQTGIGHTHYYTTIGEKLYILARSPYGAFTNQLWVYNGGGFEKVSGPFEDKMLSQGSVYSINRMSFAGQQAVAIQMTPPATATQKWLMYFPESKGWFEWESAKYGPVNNGYWFLGGTTTNKLYNFVGYPTVPSSDNYQDDATDYEFQVAFNMPKEGGHDELATMAMCGVIGDTAASTANLGVSFCDNDSTTYTTARNINTASKRKQIWRAGTYNHRKVKLSYTGSLGQRLEAFYAHTR